MVVIATTYTYLHTEILSFHACIPITPIDLPSLMFCSYTENVRLSVNQNWSQKALIYESPPVPWT